MCKVYNQIGSLTAIKSHLYRNNVSDFNSVNELISFQKNYSTTKQNIFSNHSIIIEQEKIRLNEEIKQLKNSIEINKNEFSQKLKLELEQLKQQLETLHLPQSNILKTFINKIKVEILKRKIQNLENDFDYKITNSVEKMSSVLTPKSHRYNYIISNFSDAVNQSSISELNEIERKKRIIDEINMSIYGAIGEQKVSKELEKLSNDYVLINDFTCSFQPPIYNRKENDYIKSVQIDHILISPAGIFIIETKNWSEHSLNSLSLRSPIEQIRRTHFALYVTLAEKANYLLENHHWGELKIPIRNIIVLINKKPKEEFQYVKILTLNELCNYVEYFQHNFSAEETQKIAEYLLQINESNN